MSKAFLVAASLGAALSLAGGALAHHAVNSQFDVTKTNTMTGVLVKLDNINPHAYWHFDVKGADGKVSSWNIESVAPNALRRAGVRVKEDIKVGETYTFTIAPAREAANIGLMTSLTVDGKKIPLVPGA